MLIADDILAGIVKGILWRKPGIPIYKSINQKINQSIFNTLHIWAGLFYGSPKIILSRFSWEILQTVIGFLTLQTINLLRNISTIKFIEGVTVMEGGGIGGSISFGSHIMLYPGYPAKAGHYLFMHEFGHSLQSRDSGPLYLFKYGIPSLLTNNFAWMEKDANLRSVLFFPAYASVLIRNDKTPPAEKLSMPKLWEYVLLFLLIGIVVLPYLNTERKHLRKIA